MRLGLRTGPPRSECDTDRDGLVGLAGRAANVVLFARHPEGGLSGFNPGVVLPEGLACETPRAVGDDTHPDAKAVFRAPVHLSLGDDVDALLLELDHSHVGVLGSP